MKEPRILAHRTGMAIGPPNSLIGLEKCLDAGATDVECDVTFVDGIPFVWIDDNNSLLETPVVNLNKLDPEKVLRLKRRDCNEGILPIEYFFTYISFLPINKLYLDVKYYSSDVAGLRPIPHEIIDLAIEKIVNPAIAMGIADLIGFVTFGGGVELLRAAKAASQKIATDLIVLWPWTDIRRHSLFLDSITISWKTRIHKWLWQLSDKGLQQIINNARFSGIQVNGGLASTEKEVAWLMEKRVDGIWTDNPLKINEFIKKVRGEAHD